MQFINIHMFWKHKNAFGAGQIVDRSNHWQTIENGTKFLSPIKSKLGQNNFWEPKQQKSRRTEIKIMLIERKGKLCVVLKISHRDNIYEGVYEHTLFTPGSHGTLAVWCGGIFGQKICLRRIYNHIKTAFILNNHGSLALKHEA